MASVGKASSISTVPQSLMILIPAVISGGPYFDDAGIAVLGGNIDVTPADDAGGHVDGEVRGIPAASNRRQIGIFRLPGEGCAAVDRAVLDACKHAEQPALRVIAQTAIRIENLDSDGHYHTPICTRSVPAASNTWITLLTMVR